jgi:hypothetical protein
MRNCASGMTVIDIDKSDINVRFFSFVKIFDRRSLSGGANRGSRGWTRKAMAPVQHKDVTAMKMLSHSETSFLQALLNWGADLTSRAKASMKPNYSADQIAAEVAASGSPSGA